MNRKYKIILVVIIVLLGVTIIGTGSMAVHYFQTKQKQERAAKSAAMEEAIRNAVASQDVDFGTLIEEDEQEQEKEEKEKEEKKKDEKEKKEKEKEEKKEDTDTAKEEEKPEQQQVRSATGRKVCIDPGHQASGDSSTEPNGPGSGTMKAKVAGGTQGVSTGVPEYQLTLDIGLKLKTELLNRGYDVCMTRESNDVNISNKERAEYATNQGADISVRIHANGGGAGASGALVLVPSSSNPYVSNLASASNALGSAILSAYCSATGFANQGVQANDTMTGINWCTVPVTIIEMGYMTNSSDDTKMQDPAMQQKMVQGIADGIDQYFANR